MSYFIRLKNIELASQLNINIYWALQIKVSKWFSISTFLVPGPQIHSFLCYLFFCIDNPRIFKRKMRPKFYSPPSMITAESRIENNSCICIRYITYCLKSTENQAIPTFCFYISEYILERKLFCFSSILV